MTEISLSPIVDTIVALCNAATERGERLSAEEIRDCVLRLHPGVPPALVELAFPRAAARLQAEALDHEEEAKALDALGDEADAIGREIGRPWRADEAIGDFAEAAAATGNLRAQRLLAVLRRLGTA